MSNAWPWKSPFHLNFANKAFLDYYFSTKNHYKQGRSCANYINLCCLEALNLDNINLIIYYVPSNRVNVTVNLMIKIKGSSHWYLCTSLFFFFFFWNICVYIITSWWCESIMCIFTLSISLFISIKNNCKALFISCTMKWDSIYRSLKLAWIVLNHVPLFNYIMKFRMSGTITQTERGLYPNAEPKWCMIFSHRFNINKYLPVNLNVLLIEIFFFLVDTKFNILFS